jgi:hypothetical protein
LIANVLMELLFHGRTFPEFAKFSSIRCAASLFWSCKKPAALPEGRGVPDYCEIIAATASHIHQGVSVVMICFRISLLQLFSDGYGLTAVARGNNKAPQVYEACYSRGLRRR